MKSHLNFYDLTWFYLKYITLLNLNDILSHITYIQMPLQKIFGLYRFAKLFLSRLFDDKEQRLETLF